MVNPYIEFLTASANFISIHNNNFEEILYKVESGTLDTADLRNIYADLGFSSYDELLLQSSNLASKYFQLENITQTIPTDLQRALLNEAFDIVYPPSFAVTESCADRNQCMVQAYAYYFSQLGMIATSTSLFPAVTAFCVVSATVLYYANIQNCKKNFLC